MRSFVSAIAIVVGVSTFAATAALSSPRCKHNGTCKPLYATMHRDAEQPRTSPGVAPNHGYKGVAGAVSVN